MFVLIFGIIATSFMVIWADLSRQEQAFIARIFIDYTNVILLFALLLVIVPGVMLYNFFKAYIPPAKLLAEETKLILTANPDHRIKRTGASEIRQLAAIINTFADHYQALQADVEAQISAAKSDVEEERNRLAALMSELTESVLVCNIEGRILLYNNRARQLLNQPSESGTSGLIGLGRSIFGIMDRNVITHALEHIHHHLEQDVAHPVAHFVTTAKGGQLIRAHMAPVLDQQKEITGFVLTLEDITRRVEISSRRDALLQSLTEGTRASLANIRAAVETVLEYPNMDRDRINQFTKIISDESLTLSARLDQTMLESAEYLKTQWSLEDMLGSDLISAIQRRFESKLGIITKTAVTDKPLWLKVDSYSIVEAMTSIMRWLSTDFGVGEVGFDLQEAGRFARFDMLWNGALVDTETMRTWEQQPSMTDGENNPLTLKAVAERHAGEVWYQADKDSRTAYLRLLLPITQPETTWNLPIAEEGRPEYYDFDLFHQPGQKPELDQRLLTELTYTVFDTETTGLHPSDGDEIISIGAVRILNGRLLRQEIFDQLIDPRRPVSEESIRIHGISPDMLRGQPTIDQVLPLLFQFAEDTVLVADNAAFDMRFLQMKEAQTGLKFIQPVLDTLLLSAVVHPNQEEHRLEAIARRLGINIIGRHSALGDAIVTGEIFLKLISLLAERGILTLKDAREAAQKTYFARITY